MNGSRLSLLVQDYLLRVLGSFANTPVPGVLDPDFPRTGFANPRYQEVCLAFALSAVHNRCTPAGYTQPELNHVAVSAMDAWFSLQHRSGGVRTQLSGKPDPQSTAFGLFAIASTLRLLKDSIPSAVISRAQRGVRRAAGFLSSVPLPVGPETRPLRAAALTAAANWLDSPAIHATARAIRQEGMKQISEALEHPEKQPLDAGALALALSYLVLGEDAQNLPDLELYRRIATRCLMSTTPNGLFGGGAEASLACLPVPAGFALTADRISESAKLAVLLDSAFEQQWYNAMLDPDVPWLTPMSYLALYALHQFPEKPNLDDTESVFNVWGHGCGRLQVGEWSLRLGMGGTLGWLHHIPTDSTRLFGSPAGLALREGPWLIEGSRLRHPSYAGRFKVASGDPWSIEGELFSLPIPGTERSPGRVGFPLLGARRTGHAPRLAPPPRQAAARASAPLKYKRVIGVEEGALVIETQVQGKIMHRLPMIWPGGHYGEILVDKEHRLLSHVLEERRVREITFDGGLWPAWTVRFDRPVDLLYEPIPGLVSTGPMRYLSAAGGTFDILATDRLHMAWRVE